MFSNFGTTGILKELVIAVGNEPILINTFFHYGIIWIKKCGAPRGTILNNQINHLITLAQAIGHKIPDLETSSRILRNQATKMMSFWKKLIISNLVYIKTCYSFKPVKTPSMTKNASPKTVILWNHLWLMPWGMLTKNYPFLGNTFEP